MAAGTCTGVAAALLFSVLGTGTIALLPHAARFLYWAYPVRHLGHGALYRYEVNASQNAAFYIFALLFFPLLGTGLAAWGGLLSQAGLASARTTAAEDTPRRGRIPRLLAVAGDTITSRPAPRADHHIRLPATERRRETGRTAHGAGPPRTDSPHRQPSRLRPGARACHPGPTLIRAGIRRRRRCALRNPCPRSWPSRRRGRRRSSRRPSGRRTTRPPP